MSSLRLFLENLRPGGASNIPKSKFQQFLTHDSDLDSPEEIKNGLTASNISNEIPQKRPQKVLIKQVADVHHESSEFEEIGDNEIQISSNNVGVKQSPPLKKEITENSSKPESSEIEKIWRHLKVGEEGYLSLSELEKVCIYLGMNNLNQISLQSLFKKIDTDHDGRVSFAEFLTGLKEYEKLQGSRFLSMKLSDGSVSGLFASLDSHNTGYCEREKIVKFWVSGGILNGNDVLKYFDLNTEEKINLVFLSNALEQEMNIANLDAIILAGIITYQKELYFCRFVMNAILTELNKNSDENKRDHHTDNPNYIQDLFSDFIFRQNMSKNVLTKKNEDLETIINELNRTKTDLEENLVKLRQEVSILTLENAQFIEQINEFENRNAQQIKELDAVAELHRKMDLELKFLRENKDEMEQVKYQSAVKENFQLMNDANKLGYEKRSLKLQNENEMLKNKINSLTVKIEIAINREKQFQIKLENYELDKEKMKEMKEELENLKNKFFSQECDYERKLNAVNYDMDNIEKEKQNLISSVKKLEKKILQHKNTFQQDQEYMENKCQQLENQMKTFNEIKTEISKSRNEIRSKEVIINKLEDANDRLSISVRNAISKLEVLSKNTFDISSKQLITENIQIQNENLSLEDEINQLKKKIIYPDKYQANASESECEALQMKINQKDEKINELEMKLRNIYRESPMSYSNEKRSFKKYDQLQFQYDELSKKYEIQLEQVEKTDAILKELYDGNTKLLKSLNKVEQEKENSEMTIMRLEERINTLQNLLNRECV